MLISELQGIRVVPVHGIIKTPGFHSNALDRLRTSFDTASKSTHARNATWSHTTAVVAGSFEDRFRRADRIIFNAEPLPVVSIAVLSVGAGGEARCDSYSEQCGDKEDGPKKDATFHTKTPCLWSQKL